MSLYCNGGCSCRRNFRNPISTVYVSGPQGPQGPVGQQGPIGLRGPQGPIGERGPQGPIGATGAVGPQGPAGENAVNKAAYYTNPLQRLVSGNDAAIAFSVGTPDSDFTLDGNAVVLPDAGIYKVTYSANATGATGSTVATLSLVGADGAVIAESSASETVSGTDTVNLSKSILLSANSGDRVAVRNTGTDTLTFANLGLTVERIV